MKLQIRAVVKSVGPIEPTKKGNGHVQRIVIEQPEAKDEFNRTTQPQQIFQVEIFDKEVSSKFFDAAAVGQIKDFKLWLKGEKSTDEKNGKEYYFLKLKAL